MSRESISRLSRYEVIQFLTSRLHTFDAAASFSAREAAVEHAQFAPKWFDPAHHLPCSRAPSISSIVATLPPHLRGDARRSFSVIASVLCARDVTGEGRDLLNEEVEGIVRVQEPHGFRVSRSLNAFLNLVPDRARG